MPKDEASDGTEYKTARDCIIERADGTCEVTSPLKEIIEERIRSVEQGHFSAKTIWQIAEEGWAKARKR